MKVSVNRKDFLNSLKIASSAVDKKSHLDVLRCVKLQTQGETSLIITGSNVDAFVSSRIDATQTFTGAVCVNAALITKIVKATKTPEVSLAVENGRLLVDSATLPTIAGDEFPQAPKIAPELAKFETFIMRATELAAMIDRVSYAMSDDDTRHNLYGTFWTCTPDARLLRLVATDGHRLALADERADRMPQSRTRVLPEGIDGVIVPRSAIHAIAAIVAKRVDNDLAQVAIDRNTVRVDCGTSTVTTRCIDGQFPMYDQVIPQASQCHASFQRDAMITALEKMLPFVEKKGAGVKFAFGAGRVSMLVENPLLGSMTTEILADVTRVGEYSSDLICGFNCRYLLDALRQASDDVHLSLSDDLSPATIRSTGIDGLAVVMPMRM